MLYENIRMAVTALKMNKLRTFLTMLGIIIGIASVIAILTISNGMSKSVMDSMGNMGANNISLYVEKKGMRDAFDYESLMDDDSPTRKMKTQDYINDDMLEDISNHYKNQITGFSMSQKLGNAEIKDKKKKAKIALIGVNDTALDEKNLTIVEGRALLAEEQNEGKKVAMVSDKYVAKMYKTDASQVPGQSIDVLIGNKYYSYTIVGVYEYKAQADSLMGSNSSNVRTDVYIPFSTSMHQSKTDGQYQSVEVVSRIGVDSQSLATTIADYINNKYYMNNDTYQVYGYSMQQIIGEMNSVLDTVKLAFMAIAAISLLVGGIGVMNIMVVSVTERTREIGTRKALGATNGSIRMQFITEAVIVCLMGGIIGVIFGVSLGMLITGLMGSPGTASIPGIVGCVLFSMFFGVFFGYYPAGKAAKMDPIEALRYE